MLKWAFDCFYLTFCCCTKKGCRAKKVQKIAMRRIDRELDVVTFLRKQMALTAMLRAWSSKYERALSRQNYRLIVSDDSQTDNTTSESDSSFECESRQPSSGF